MTDETKQPEELTDEQMDAAAGGAVVPVDKKVIAPTDLKGTEKTVAPTELEDLKQIVGPSDLGGGKKVVAPRD